MYDNIKQTLQQALSNHALRRTGINRFYFFHYMCPHGCHSMLGFDLGRGNDNGWTDHAPLQLYLISLIFKIRLSFFHRL
jgi:hypothetical protein